MLIRILITFAGLPTLLIERKDVEDLPSSQTPSIAYIFYPGGELSAKIIRHKFF